MTNHTECFSSLHSSLRQNGVGSREPLMLAVSGGADSMALMTALAESKRPNVTVAHVDHGLRSESPLDADFVRAQAKNAEFKFQLLQIAPGTLEKQREGSLEDAARRERYHLLTEAATGLGIAFIATAHHFDDQAETVLHNIVRGTGLRGLRGMQPVRNLSSQIKLVRPMLDIPRESIERYLAERGIEYREDITNSTDAHTRNRLRHSILPQLQEAVNEGANRNLVNLASQSQELLSDLDEIADQILSECVLDQTEDSCRMTRSGLTTWPTPIVRHAMTALWIRLNWPRKKMTRGHYQQLASIALAGVPSRSDFPAGVTVTVDGNLMRLQRNHPQPESQEE